MYVDKKLRSVAAVQTLSRLNRIFRGYNKKTFILDFKNTYEDIQSAFALIIAQRFYQKRFHLEMS